MFKRVGFLLAVISTLCGQSIAQDIESRIAQYQFQKAQVSECMSVLIEKVSVRDGVGLVPEEVGNTPRKYERQLSSTRTFQRLVFGSNGKKKRLDGLEYSLLGNKDLANVDREAQLIHENVGWYFNKSRNTPKRGVEQIQIKGGVVPMTTDTRWNHPFNMATTQAAGITDDKEVFLGQISLKTFEEETLKDGRTRLTVFNGRRGVYRMTFNKDEEWFTEEIEFFHKKRSREEEMAEARGGGPRYIALTKEELAKYKSYAVNRTEWKEVEKQWVPWVTRISSEGLNENEEYEIRYRDWKFMGDVDESLLDEANFTPEKIAASIDFKAIRDMFDRSK